MALSRIEMGFTIDQILYDMASHCYVQVVIVCREWGTNKITDYQVNDIQGDFIDSYHQSPNNLRKLTPQEIGD